jgi:hypothetical protein
MSGGFMSPEQRLQALTELELRQQRNQSRVVRSVWGSIVVGALVLGSIIAFASWQLANVRREVDSLSDQRQRLKTEIAELGEQKKIVDQQLTAAKGVLKDVPDAQLKLAIDKQFAAAPQTAALLPRIYMQIVDRADTARAQAIRKALQDAGYLVLGIEYVPDAQVSKASDVRFYHLKESDEAKKIAQVLTNAGEPNVKVNYLQKFENNTKARPNHFEVWLVHHVE